MVDGLNGARIQPSSSAISPSGAICTLPSALRVVTMVSRIIGIAYPPLAPSLRGLALLLGDQRVTCSLELGLVVGRGIGGNAPVERLVLGIALGEPPGDLGAGQLDPEIEGVRSVLVDVELGVEIEHVLRDVMAVAVVDMDAVLGDLDAEVLVAHLAGDSRRSPPASAGTGGGHGARAGRRRSPSADHARRGWRT